MSEAATQKGVADMSESDMVNSLAAMFDVEVLPDEQEEVTAAEKAEATSDDATAPEEVEADEDMESEVDDESDDEDEESSDDEKWTPQTLDELAEALDMQPEDVASTLKVKIKVDGQEGEATLKDVIKSYQLEKTLNQRLEAHATERKAFEAQSQQTAESLKTRLQEAESTLTALEKMLFSEYEGVNWAELKNDDPTEYMLKQSELRDRYVQLQQVRTKYTEDQKQQEQERQKSAQEGWQAYVKEQHRLILEKLPEWRDQKKMTADLEQLQTYLRQSGYSDQEIAMAADHRQYITAIKAMRYDELQSKADPKMKQMKTKPKFVKPGTRKSPTAASEKTKQSSMSRAKKLQTDDAWAEALLAKLS